MNHSFNVNFAMEYGVNEALVFNEICYWYNRNQTNPEMIKEGYIWCYIAISKFKEILPYLTEHQIRGALKTLKNEELILVGDYNHDTLKKTKWYALSKKGIELCDKYKIAKGTTNNKKNNTNYKNSDTICENSDMICEKRNYVNNKNKVIKNNGVNINNSYVYSPPHQDDYIDTEVVDMEFEISWRNYGEHGNRHIAGEEWTKLTQEEKDIIKKHLPLYVKNTPDIKYRKYFENYLKTKLFINKPIIQYEPRYKKDDFNSYEWLDSLFEQ